jgi:UDP-N-acetylmuramoyl-L-alanyl-D-glutamate--2,6-diaminopimelate ligase
MINFRKFPDIELEGKRLIWDSRQSEGDLPERVYLNPLLSEDLRNALLRRPRVAELVEDAPMRQLAVDASRALGVPSSRLKVIGVTGTNGKTSTTHLMAYVLASVGHRVLQIGTLGIDLWEADPGGPPRVVAHEESGFTTPEAPSLHDIMRQAAEAGVTHVVMEVSSHALSLDRVAGVEFDLAVFTNLSQDHLDFHASMEDYATAKRLLFERELVRSSKPLKWAVVAVPDSTSKRLFGDVLQLPESLNLEKVLQGSGFVIESEKLDGVQIQIKGESRLQSRLIGEHNAWNIAVCFRSLQLLESFSVEDFNRALKTYAGAVGRLERVGERCFVDYAHSPDALEKVLQTLHASKSTTQKLVVVFGCGGDRDKSKRPLMGEIASRYADSIWLTNDNPRGEDPSCILDDILSGIPENDRAKVTVCADRAEAIGRAIQSSTSHDIVAVCGKGHESYQIIGNQKLKFSDQDCIRKSLEASVGSAG